LVALVAHGGNEEHLERLAVAAAVANATALSIQRRNN
jgi:hypothetical protein